MILFLHNRYRVTGGEERVVADLLALVRDELGEDAELLERDSAALGRARAAAGLLRGGLAPEDVAAAVRRTRARVVHAHNLNPALGWRALAAARAAGARVVLHLHNYRVVCAVGTCFNSRGEDCTRCQGRNTLPGVRLNCRATGPESAAYAVSLALWQRRLVDHAGAVVVPSAFARERLRAMRAPLEGADVHVVPHPVAPAAVPADPTAGTYALVASRLAPEKGVADAIAACAIAQLRLVVAGDGPLASRLEASATGDVRFTGHVDAAELARLRAGAALAIVPTHAAETFGLAAAEAMAAGLPVAASRAGALPELLDDGALAPPGDPETLAGAVRDLYGDADAGARNAARIAQLASPAAVAARLAAIYEG